MLLPVPLKGLSVSNVTPLPLGLPFPCRFLLAKDMLWRPAACCAADSMVGVWIRALPERLAAARRELLLFLPVRLLALEASARSGSLALRAPNSDIT